MTDAENTTQAEQAAPQRRKRTATQGDADATRAMSDDAQRMLALHRIVRQRRSVSLADVADEMGAGLDDVLALAQACPSITARHSLGGWGLQVARDTLTDDEARQACVRLARSSRRDTHMSVGEARRILGDDVLRQALQAGGIGVAYRGDGIVLAVDDVQVLAETGGEDQ